LFQAFDRQLTLSREEDIKLKLIEDPFSVDPEELPMQLQLEVIELKCLSVYQNKHQETSLQQFCKSPDMDILKNIRGIALRVFTIFVSTYIWQQAYSIMNLNENKQQSSLTIDHLEDILKTLDMVSEYEEHVAGVQCNVSH
jgi:hypothetical protein